MQPVLRTAVRRSNVVLAALALVAMAATPATANKCTGAKLKPVGKKVKALLGCSGREATQGTAAAMICNIKVHDKFTAAYNKPQCLPAPPVPLSATRCENDADDCQM